MYLFCYMMEFFLNINLNSRENNRRLIWCDDTILWLIYDKLEIFLILKYFLNNTINTNNWLNRRFRLYTFWPERMWSINQTLTT